jgi:hypothetical protein
MFENEVIYEESEPLENGDGTEEPTPRNLKVRFSLEAANS